MKADVKRAWSQWFVVPHDGHRGGIAVELEREVASIRWFVGTQLAYVVITLGAMYFMLQRLAH